MESWVTDYLDRIKYQGSFRATPANLADLHQAHMYAVPFEDLDIHQGLHYPLIYHTCGIKSSTEGGVGFVTS